MLVATREGTFVSMLVHKLDAIREAQADIVESLLRGHAWDNITYRNIPFC